MPEDTRDSVIDPYLEEYSSDDAIRRYTSATAGQGIDYLLHNDYADIYRDAIGRLPAVPDSGLRLLEYGCGGGMNLLNLVGLLGREGQAVDAAYGTDFSPRLIDAAQAESRQLLAPADRDRVSFHVARNEALKGDLAESLDVPADSLEGTFQLIFGVNTFRYCNRIGGAADCVADIRSLLAPGGMTVMIDMNGRFPVFRSRIRDRLNKPEQERYLPGLEEYATPFADGGLEVIRKDTFCWIPHSAGRFELRVMRGLGPVLDKVAHSRAMRCLVVARRPVE